MAEKKILLVDYDAKSLASLSKLLKSHKFKVVTATDGQAGYDAFLAEKPDLVILEAMLPKIHGFDLTRKITQDEKALAPVIIITGLYKGPKYRREAIKDLGAAAYFEKPIDPEAFVAAIRRLLHDEDEIDEDLPGSDAVIEALSRRDRGRAATRAEAKPTAKGHHP